MEKEFRKIFGKAAIKVWNNLNNNLNIEPITLFNYGYSGNGWMINDVDSVYKTIKQDFKNEKNKNKQRRA